MFAAKAYGKSRVSLLYKVKKTAGNYVLRSVSSPTHKVINSKESKHPQARISLRDMPGPSMYESLSRLANEGFRYHHLFVEEMFERYGPVFKHSLPGTDIVYVSDTVDIEHVFRAEEAKNPYKGDSVITKYYDEIGLAKGISGDDETWYPNRRAIADKILRLGALKVYFNEIMNVADDTISKLNDGRNFDLKDHLTKWATENIGLILFGFRIGANYDTHDQIAMKLVNAVDGLFEAETRLILGVPFHRYFKTPTLRQAYRHISVLTDISRSFLEKTRNEASPLTEMSLVERLKNEDEFPDDMITQACVILFVGGIHTTVNNVVLLFHALSKQPEVQQKAYEEIQRVLGDQIPTYKHLAKMPYLKCVIKEGFRYTVSPLGNLRITKCPITVRGYDIPPGTTVSLMTVASKEMQKQKYGDPERFNPERWLRGSEDRPHPFSSMPFGFGKRACVGKRVVELELSLLLIRLLQKYEIIENTFPDDQVDWIFNCIVIADRPYVMYLKQRM